MPIEHLAADGMQARTVTAWDRSLSLGPALGGQLFDLLGRWELGAFALNLTAMVSIIALLNIRLLRQKKPLML